MRDEIWSRIWHHRVSLLSLDTISVCSICQFQWNLVFACILVLKIHVRHDCHCSYELNAIDWFHLEQKIQWKMKISQLKKANNAINSIHITNWQDGKNGRRKKQNFLAFTQDTSQMISIFLTLLRWPIIMDILQMLMMIMMMILTDYIFNLTCQFVVAVLPHQTPLSHMQKKV